MDDVHTVLSARPLNIFVQYGIGSAFFLSFRIDGQQTLHLLDDNDICILIYNLQQFVAELFTSFLAADLHFHARFQREIVLRCDNTVHIYNSFAQ